MKMIKLGVKKITVLMGLMMWLWSARMCWADVGSFSVTKINEGQKIFNIENFGYSPELTPLVYRQENGQWVYMVTTSWSWKCLSNKNLAFGDVLLNKIDCNLVSTPEAFGSVANNGDIGFKDLSCDSGDEVWRRTYDGVMGMVFLDDRVVLARYGENQNSGILGGWVCNSVVKNIPMTGGYTEIGWPYTVFEDGCVANYYNGTYIHCWDSFTSYVSVGWSPYNKNDGWVSKEKLTDLGPVVWPKDRYTNSDGSYYNMHGSYGNPTLFRDGDNLYLFTLTKGSDMKPGDDLCVSMAKSKIGDKGEVASWSYANGSKTVPDGFSKTSVKQFLDKSNNYVGCVNRASNTIQVKNPQHFSVAKIRGSNYYIAAEEGAYDKDGNGSLDSWLMGIRLSNNLIDWSDIKILESADGSWGNGNYAYPVFLDRNGETNSEIDAGEFYILGKRATNSKGYELNVMELSLNIDGFANIYKLSREERLVYQYYKEFLGWNKKTTDDDFKWHVINFWSNGCVSDIRNFLESSVFLSRTSGMSDSDLVKLLYRGALSRESNEAEISWWVSKIGSEGRQSAINELLQAGEVLGVCKGGKYLDYVPECMDENGNSVSCDMGCVGLNVATIDDLIRWYTSHRNGTKEGDINCDGEVNIDDLIKWYEVYRE